MEILRKATNFVESKINKDPQVSPEFILSEGGVEKLVREGRTPFILGTIGIGEEESHQLLFQVPPPDHQESVDVYPVFEYYVYEYPDGSKKFGSTFALSEEQVVEMGERVSNEEEKQRLEKGKLF